MGGGGRREETGTFKEVLVAAVPSGPTSPHGHMGASLNRGTGSFATHTGPVVTHTHTHTRVRPFTVALC